MKKVSVLFCLILILLLFPSCAGKGYIIEKTGMTEYRFSEGFFEINHCILPSGDFITQYSPVAEDYHYIATFEHKFDIECDEKSIIIFRYAPSVYQEAKAYCLSEMDLRDIGIPDLNGYCFLENYRLALGREDELKNGCKAFPMWYNLFAYNDSGNTLVFIGGYNPECNWDGIEEDAKRIIDDWPNYVEQYFPEILANTGF